MSAPFTLLAQMRPFLAPFLRLSQFHDRAQELVKKKKCKRCSFKSTNPVRIISDSIKQCILLLSLEVTAYKRWEHGLKVPLGTKTFLFPGLSAVRTQQLCPDTVG